MAKTTPKRKGKPVGRYVSAEERGRYTKPRPTNAEHSPRWFGWVLISLLLLGVLTITFNYLQVLPGSVSAWYLVAGLAMMFAAFYLATRFH